MTAPAAKNVLRISGRPHALMASLDTPAAAAGTVTVSCATLPETDGPVDLRARIKRGHGSLPATLSLKLAPTTPPGAYKSVLDIGGEKRPVVIDVQPHPRTRLLVSDGEVAGVAGSQHTLITTLVNLGNVPLDVPAVVRVRLTDADVLDAVLTAVSAKTDSDERLRAFADGLANADGGTVELAIAGAGTLDPGATRELTASVRVPDGLLEGRTYAGSWAVGEARFSLRLRRKQASKKEHSK